MASVPANLPSLVDRADVHKSCKSLEVLLNILNDYCEAAGAVVTLQKKLVKALKETAALKVTGEIPANALNTSANIFDSLSEIDSKFSKIADKEYDIVSAEVKKWFKKLTKEEKAHDERINAANAKIKQAGQNYEKKAKKNARDAAEEHAKYINLISTLGPELSQEKYNHSLNVTQRHAQTTYSVAACVSRIADAEWLRACEGVRRFSPNVGNLGEWRSLCEGGWAGTLPHDLPNIDTTQDPRLGLEDARHAEPLRNTEDTYPSYTQQKFNDEPADSDVAAFLPNSTYPSDNEQALDSPRPNIREQHSSQPPGRSSAPPPSSYEPPKLRFAESEHGGSVRSLSVFPSPPTHFPIPPVNQSPVQQRNISQGSISPSSASNSQIGFPPSGGSRSTRSPVREEEEGEEEEQKNGEVKSREEQISSSDAQHFPPSPDRERGRMPFTETPTESPELTNRRPLPQPASPSEQWSSLPSMSRNASGTTAVASNTTGSGDTDKDEPARNGGRVKALERVDTTGSTDSHVQAMRSRYSSHARTTSPTPREVPRLPVSVTDLANRYKPSDPVPPSPTQRRAMSPPAASRPIALPPLDTLAQTARMAESSFQTPSSPPPSAVNRAKEDELRERERRLHEMERDIKQRERNLDEHGTKFGRGLPPPFSRDKEDHERPRQSSYNGEHQARPVSYADNRAMSSSGALGRTHHYSQSATHLSLQPPTHSPTTSHQYRRSNEYSHSQSSLNPSFKDDQRQEVSGPHAPSCGCVTCSVVKYRQPASPSSPYELRPPSKPLTLRPEKQKGWIRRLSMPVVANFSGDGKKDKGIGSAQFATKGGGIFSMDGRQRRLSGLSGVGEDGRRSYDSGAGSRSVSSNGFSR